MTTAETKYKVPRTLADATAMLERLAALSASIAQSEARRNKAIAEANAEADKAQDPLLAERKAIAQKLAPWWKRAGTKLAGDSRKSIELGGCMIGTRKGKDTLSVAGDQKAIVTKLKGLRWAKKLLRVTTNLDKPAILKVIDGPHAAELKEVGLSKDLGQDEFFVAAVEQGGTIAGREA